MGKLYKFDITFLCVSSLGKKLNSHESISFFLLLYCFTNTFTQFTKLSKTAFPAFTQCQASYENKTILNLFSIPKQIAC